MNTTTNNNAKTYKACELKAGDVLISGTVIRDTVAAGNNTITLKFEDGRQVHTHLQRLMQTLDPAGLEDYNH